MALPVTRHSGSRGTLLALIIILAALLIYLLAGGWERLLAEFIGGPVQRTIIALVIAIVAVFLARVLGEEHAARADEDDQRVSFSLPIMIFMYFVLIFISTMGTVNSLLYRFEGATILRDAADVAQNDIAAFNATARNSLFDAPQEERRAAVERGLASLTQEINHPQGRCGVGPNATAIINDIARVLPGFRMISERGVGPGCNREVAAALVRSYRAQAEQILANDADYVRANGPRKAAFLASLDAETQSALVALRQASVSLARGSDSFPEVQAALETTNNFFVDKRSQLVTLAPSLDAQLPRRLDIDAARGLGLFSHVLPILAERRDRFSTYFFPIAAIIFDLLLVGLFRQYALAARGPRRDGRGRKDPQFLWVNA